MVVAKGTKVSIPLRLTGEKVCSAFIRSDEDDTDLSALHLPTALDGRVHEFEPPREDPLDLPWFSQFGGDR